MQESIWKVLIADDEAIIREGIRGAVDWESLQMSVVAEAEDGEEALELAVKHSVDIMLVDLNMPIMNGITLIKHIRDELPFCKIIIITGHDEFSYAQEAIRLNVVDYILKPANPEQLTNVLRSVLKDLEVSVQKQKYLQMASEQISKNLYLLKERFCREWIEGNMTEDEIVEQLQFLQLPTESPQIFGVIRWPELHTNQPLLKVNDRQLYLFAIENIVMEFLEVYPKVIFRDENGLIIVCVWEAVADEVFAEIEKAVQTYLKIAISLYFEQVQDGLMSIPDLYRQCKMKVYQESQISPIVRRARQFIREQYFDPNMTLESFAQTLQVSPVYLSRVIKQELGSSFVSLVTQMRISKAIQLLNSTDLPIHEIAERVGYDTQHYFSTAFRKVMGVAPNQYRKGALFGGHEHNNE